MTTRACAYLFHLWQSLTPQWSANPRTYWTYPTYDDMCVRVRACACMCVRGLKNVISGISVISWRRLTTSHPHPNRDGIAKIRSCASGQPSLVTRDDSPPHLGSLVYTTDAGNSDRVISLVGGLSKR